MRMRWLWPLALSGLAVLLIAGRAEAGFSQIVAFGDSLSDTGNAYYLSTHPIVAPSVQSPSSYPPSPPYYQGRFSDGPIWVDRLAGALGVAAPAPAYAPGGGTDYAVGGATTGDGFSPAPGYSALLDFTNTPVVLVPTLQTQVANYLGAHAADPDALYTVWAGANDLFGGQADPSVPASNIAGAVQSLLDAGAKHVLVFNLPPLGDTPLGQLRYDPAALNGLTAQFNADLAADLAALKAAPGASIATLDIFTLFRQIEANPAAYGFTSPGFALQPGATGDPDSYLFWDIVHPTAPVEQLIADAALTAVPEPSSLALLLAAVPALVARRRRRAR